MILASLDTNVLLSALTVAVMAVGVALGVPAWRLARNQVHTLEVQELAQAVARVLVGTDHPADMNEPSVEHPSLIDLLSEVRDNTSEMSAVALVLAYHMADRHGGPVPDRIDVTQPTWMRSARPK